MSLYITLTDATTLQTIYSIQNPKPKSYFANERTFIQWIGAALLMVTVASILMEFGNESATTTSLILFILSMVIIVYGLVVYLRRIFLMQNQRVHGYVDFYGPAFLSVAIMFGIGAVIFQYYRSPSVASAVSLQQQTIRVESNQCVNLGLGGRSPLNYVPSDILVDTARDILIVPSMKEITSFSMNIDEKEIKVLAEIAEANIEAMTYSEKAVFTMLEAGKKSELFAHNWNQDENELQLVGR